MRSRTPRAAGPRAVDRARSRVRRARLARSSGTPRASNARDSRAFRRVRSSSADAEASARAVARPTSAPPTIVLDDAMSAWATRALDVAPGEGNTRSWAELPVARDGQLAFALGPALQAAVAEAKL